MNKNSPQVLKIQIAAHTHQANIIRWPFVGMLLKVLHATQHVSFVFGDEVDKISESFARATTLHLEFRKQNDVQHVMTTSGWSARLAVLPTRWSTSMQDATQNKVPSIILEAMPPLAR